MRVSPRRLYKIPRHYWEGLKTIHTRVPRPKVQRKASFITKVTDQLGRRHVSAATTHCCSPPIHPHQNCTHLRPIFSGAHLLLPVTMGSHGSKKGMSHTSSPRRPARQWDLDLNCFVPSIGLWGEEHSGHGSVQ